jgi:hypothetical protein
MKPDNFETKILDNASDMILALLAVERSIDLSNVVDNDSCVEWLNASNDAAEAVKEVLKTLRSIKVIH